MGSKLSTKGALSTPRNQFTVNLRVDDFDGLIEKLKAKKITVERTADYS